MFQLNASLNSRSQGRSVRLIQATLGLALIGVVSTIAVDSLAQARGASTAATAHSPASRQEIEKIKLELLTIAKKYQGQGDPDGSIQRQLDPLVNKLLAANPQPPVARRLNLIYGAWRQVWGPYEYRRGDRSVDPTLDPKNIVQVVFEGGYYYNVNPARDRSGQRDRISLLRGEFTPSSTDPNGLDVRFTNLRRADLEVWNTIRLSQMPALSEAGNLRTERTVLPGLFVRLFFGGGTLREVYTDHDLRIAYGNSRDGNLQDYLYVLRRTR